SIPASRVLDAGIEPYANIKRWAKTVGERPAVQRGMAVPAGE
ncbi:MAG: glutathione S-transferase, partial [Pseudomonadota bacterium]